MASFNSAATGRAAQAGFRGLLLHAGFSLLIAAGLLLPSAAQSEAPAPALVQFDFFTQLDSTPPSLAEEARAIRVSGELLASLEVGEEIAFNAYGFASGFTNVTLRVSRLEQLPNGDATLQAIAVTKQGIASLTLTASAENAYGYFSSSEGNWQIVSKRRQDNYVGWLYRPKSLDRAGHGLQNDYLIVEPGGKVQAPVTELNSWRSPELPLSLGSSPFGSSSDAGATLEGINDSNFLIEQRFAANPVIAGGKAEALVSFQNISGEFHRDLSVEFYFLLENSTLLSAPSECSEQLSLSLQRVLFCSLGSFAPGETKTLNYLVQTDAGSLPIVNSSAIVGDARSYVALNVVNDVVSDSDGDGLSDFNENLLGSDPLDAASFASETTQIDVMALYTAEASAAFGSATETRINQLISVANQVYSNSQLAIRLRPVYMGEVSGIDGLDMETGLNQLLDREHPEMQEIDSLRSRFGADLVMVFRTLEPGATRCGLAPVGGFNTNGDFSAAYEKELGFSVIALDCPHDIVVAHELGHNMGLTHSQLEDGAGGTFDYSTGYGVEGQFVTIMAAPAAFATETRVPQFSDPEIDCLEIACGVDAESNFGADAVRSLNIVRHQIANYYPATVQSLPEFPTAGTLGLEYTARAFIGATADEGLTWRTSFSPGLPLSVQAELVIDNRHVNETGAIHAAVMLDDGTLQQVSNDGRLIAWDGDPGSLVALGGFHPLAGRESFRVLEEIVLTEAGPFRSLAIYLAYRVPVFFNEIIFTAEPLLVEVAAE